MRMIEHMSLPVKDHKRSKEFYSEALKPLQYKLNMDFEGASGFMEGGHTSFWIVEKPQGQKLHVAFLAKSKEMVDEFHKVAVNSGAKDNGAPGYRKDYSPDYYAAFVLDPEGNNIEAVWYDPEKQ
jgi:predicted lactoylglutathione lyase